MIETRKKINSTRADTRRFVMKGNKLKEAQQSTNRGLESYLCESIVSSGIDEDWILSELRESVGRILDESQIFNGARVWGWEKAPTISGLKFPFDWDDTAKAIDAINSARILTKQQVSMLPTSDYWEEELRRSLFTTDEIGEEYRFSTQNQIALSVFFGPGSENIIPRDDPMVTVTAIRTTLQWFPSVHSSMEAEIHALFNRCISVLNESLKRDVDFSALSRYYFSLGHFMYRLSEVIDLLNLSYEEVGIDLGRLNNKMKESIDCIDYEGDIRNCQDMSAEYCWWYLLAMKTNNNQLFRDRFHKPLSKCSESLIYRHKRLNHYYSSEQWLDRILSWERSRIESTDAALIEQTMA